MQRPPLPAVQNGPGLRRARGQRRRSVRRYSARPATNLPDDPRPMLPVPHVDTSSGCPVANGCLRFYRCIQNLCEPNTSRLPVKPMNVDDQNSSADCFESSNLHWQLGVSRKRVLHRTVTSEAKQLDQPVPIKVTGVFG